MRVAARKKGKAAYTKKEYNNLAAKITANTQKYYTQIGNKTGESFNQQANAHGRLMNYFKNIDGEYGGTQFKLYKSRSPEANPLSENAKGYNNLLKKASNNIAAIRAGQKRMRVHRDKYYTPPGPYK